MSDLSNSGAIERAVLSILREETFAVFLFFIGFLFMDVFIDARSCENALHRELVGMFQERFA